MSNVRPDPYVPVLLLCSGVSAESPSHPCTYENVVDTFQVPWEACAMDDAPRLPGALTLVMTLRSEASAGSRRVELEHRPPGGEPEVLRSEQLDVAPGGSYTLGVQMVELPMRRGTHWFVARLDGEEVQRTPLRVLFRDQYGNAT